MKCSQERWEEAQRAEVAGWAHRLHSKDPTMTDGFGWYIADWLKNVCGGVPYSVLEVGTGPLVSLRFFSSPVRVGIEPLLEEYKRSGFDLTGPETHCRMIGLPAEEVVLDEQFDLVFSVNVLDHCRDSEAVLENMIRWTKRSGVLVLRTDMRRPEQSTPCHPIALTPERVEQVFFRMSLPVWARLSGPPASGGDASLECTWYCGREGVKVLPDATHVFVESF